MRAFTYERVGDVASAVAALGSHPGARLIAGGTTMVDLMRLGVESPDHLVDVSRVDFGGITEEPDGALRVGAGVRNSDLAGDMLVRSRHPLIAEAVLAGASGQLRNMATLGGNLLQRTRCVFFNDVTTPCNKREPGSGCSARDSHASRELAILGASPSCLATFPGDLAVALAALDAEVHVQTATGASTLTLDELYRLPGDRPELDTMLPEGAVITAVTVPAPPPGLVSVYRKARDRQSFAFGLATVAAALRVDDGRVTAVRLAFGGVAHRPWRARRAEDVLLGGPATPSSFSAALTEELAAARPTPENAFKVELVHRLAVGALTDLSARQERAA